MLLDDLRNLGCDIDDGLNRFLGNDSLYEKMLKKFPASILPLSENIIFDIDNGNIKEAISNTHTIKGVAGNLSLTPLYESYTKIVTLLREEKFIDAKNIYLEILPTQEKILNLINEA